MKCHSQSQRCKRDYKKEVITMKLGPITKVQKLEGSLDSQCEEDLILHFEMLKSNTVDIYMTICKYTSLISENVN